MQVSYVPLLAELQRLYTMPRDRRRFETYLQTMANADRSDLDLPPLVLVNPMAREHILETVDALLAMNADQIAQDAIAEASRDMQDLPDSFPASLVVLDDLKGGWTNRFAYELELRKTASPRTLKPRQAQRYWITGTMWSSESPTTDAVRQAVLCALYRTCYVLRHDAATSLSDLLRQEGWVMTKAGCRLPPLSTEDSQWTREVITSNADRSDTATLIECLFGDDAAATLGYAGQGLEPWAGLRLALAEHGRQSAAI